LNQHLAITILFGIMFVNQNEQKIFIFAIELKNFRCTCNGNGVKTCWKSIINL